MSMGSREPAGSPPRARVSGPAGADKPDWDCTSSGPYSRRRTSHNRPSIAGSRSRHWSGRPGVGRAYHEYSCRAPSAVSRNRAPECYDRVIPMNALLALEDGSWYRGVAAGAQGEARGEVVFNTSMTGYQEVLTDPSYAGQIVTMTAPQIGNYGVAAGDAESQTPHVAGFVMREASPLASNWRADGTLREYLVRHNIVAIGDIDTRALTRVLRSAGVMRGVIATGQVDRDELVEKARAIPKMEGADLVKDVTCENAFAWREQAPQAGEQDHR